MSTYLPLTPYPPTYTRVTNTVPLTVSNPASCSSDAARVAESLISRLRSEGTSASANSSTARIRSKSPRPAET